MTYSIIIPTYNSAKTLNRCLDSVLAQTCKDFEILLMDGLSKDDTVQKALSYKDNRIKVYSEPDKGIYDAMNKGIDKAMGTWLLFLGSDDYLYEDNVLLKILPFLSNDLDVIYGEVESHWSELHRGEWSLDKIDANRCHQAILYNSHFFGAKLRYNLKYPILADFDMNLKWFLNSKYRHLYIPILIAHFTDGGCSTTMHDDMFYRDFGLNKLKYNRHVLTPLYKKRAARQWVEANPDKFIMKGILTLYAYIMSVLYKVTNLKP